MLYYFSGGPKVDFIEITGILGTKLVDIRNICAEYLHGMADTGSRNLIHSLIEQKKTHISELKELAESRELSQVSFPESETRAYLDRICNTAGFSSDMSHLEFLQFIEQRLVVFHEFYSFLAGHAGNEESSFLFRRFEEEDRKEAALIRDRFDLLTLSS